MRKLILGCVVAALATSCNNNVKSSTTTESDSAAATKGDVLVSNMDSSVSPGQDFFQYANGGWIKSNPIPGDQGAWGIGNLVVEENLKRLRTISEKAATANAAQGSNEQKIGDFWSTAMSTLR